MCIVPMRRLFQGLFALPIETLESNRVRALSHRPGENFELRADLNSEYRDKRKDAIKRVIANMTVGKGACKTSRIYRLFSYRLELSARQTREGRHTQKKQLLV